MWPPSSADLNPLDFSVWARVEVEACSEGHPNLISLKAKINEAWDALSQEYIRNVCASFRRRVEAVIHADGDYIE